MLGSPSLTNPRCSPTSIRPQQCVDPASTLCDLTAARCTDLEPWSVVGGPYRNIVFGHCAKARRTCSTAGPTKECLGCDRCEKNDRNSPKHVQPSTNKATQDDSDRTTEKTLDECCRYRLVTRQTNGNQNDGNSIEKAKLFQERLLPLRRLTLYPRRVVLVWRSPTLTPAARVSLAAGHLRRC